MDRPLDPGVVIERYEVLGLLGEGGLARVYKVRHTQLGTTHALKLLTMRKDGLAQRLLLEGRIQAQLRHPNIVVVSDVVQHEGQPGLVIEYVEGPTLDEWLREQGPFPIDAGLRLFAGVLAAVRGAHAAGVLHRDLKPANILLQGKRPVPKVADFGIAKVALGADVAPAGRGKTQAGVAMGTPGYMAPEQFNDAAGVDARADIFALGTILYEVLTGQAAFGGDTLLDTLNAVAEGRYRPMPEVNPDVPAAVADAMARAVSADASKRYPDCEAFAEALYADRPELLAVVLAGDPVSLTALQGESPARPYVASTNPGPTYTKGAENATMVASPLTLNPEQLADEPDDDEPAPSPRPRRSRRPLYAALGIGLVSAFGLLVATTAGGVWLWSPGDPPSGTGASNADAPAVAAAPPPAAAPGDAEPEPAPLGAADGEPVAAKVASAARAAPPRAEAPAPPGTASSPPAAKGAATTGSGVATDAVAAASTAVPPAPAASTSTAPAAPTSSITTEAPAIPSIKGTWSGRWNGRPLTMRVEAQSGSAVRARVEVLLGTTPRGWSASGTFDGTKLSLAGDDGFVMTGTLTRAAFAGTVVATGQRSAPWDAHQ